MSDPIKADTPRTDGLAIEASLLPPFQHAVPAELARNLERELAEARELLREIRDNEVNAADEADKYLRDHQPSELSRLRAEVDQYRADMERMDRDWRNLLQVSDTAKHFEDNKSLRAQLAETARENALLAAGPAEAGWWSPATAKAYEKEVAALRAQLAARDEALKVAREALKTSDECATSIRRNIDEDMGGIPDDDIWLTTIRAHGYVIMTDCRHALTRIDQLTKETP